MTSVTTVKERSRLKFVTNRLAQYRIVVLFLAMASAATLLIPYFATKDNLTSLLTQTAIYAILVVGISFPIMAGGIDLSIGSILFLSGACYALFQDFGLLTAVIAGVVAGILAGILNGVLITKARINFFIATLASAVGLRGLGLTITKGNSMPGHIPGFEWLGNTRVYLGRFPVEIPVFVAIVFVIGAHLIITRTQLGRNILAIGGNRVASMLAGINVDRTFFTTFVLSGFMAGIAGVLLASRLVSASTLVGEESALTGVSAAVLGGVSIYGGTGSMVGAVLGLIILQIIGNCLNLLTVQAYYQFIIRGFIVISVIIFDAYYNPRRGQIWG